MKVTAVTASAIAVAGILGTTAAAQARVSAIPDGATIRDVNNPGIAGYFQTDSRFPDAYTSVGALWHLPIIPLGGVRTGAKAADWVDLNSLAGKEAIGVGSLEQVVGAPEHRSVRYSLFYTTIPGKGIVTLPTTLTLRHGDEIQAGVSEVGRDRWGVDILISNGRVGTQHLEEMLSRTVRFSLPALNESCEALESRVLTRGVLAPLARTSSVQFRDAGCVAIGDFIPLTQAAPRATVFHSTMVSGGKVLARASSPPGVGSDGSQFTVTDAFGD